MVTRRPPRIPCRITPTTAITPRFRSHRRSSPSQSHTARMIVRNPTSEPIKRCVCSNKIPPTHFETGNKNMLYPKVVGQSGTASPTFLLVTIPPLQISRSVAMHVSHANRFNHFVDLPESLQFILEKITANSADFADGFLVAVALWATWHKCSFTSARRFAQRSGYS